MSLFVMADTHLSIGNTKVMDVFGNRWQGYVDKIAENWRGLVEAEDTVVIPGDISWGMKLEEAREDLKFLHELPGKKVLLKGNHDYWWSTMKKLEDFRDANGFHSLRFLHNSAIRCENYILCGSRGWYTEDRRVVSQADADAKKIVAREVGRLRSSLEAGKAIHDEVLKNENIDCEMLVFLHFPPYYRGYICDEIVLELYRYSIRSCYFGHIHGVYDVPMTREYMDIRFTMVAADYLNFRPLRLPDAPEGKIL